MQTYDLIPHASAPPVGVSGIEVIFGAMPDGTVMLRFIVSGTGHLHVPPLAGKGRRDGLWQTTCFELFLRPADGESYREYNFSPSGYWASYGFARYREDMTEHDPIDWPQMDFMEGSDRFIATIYLGRGELAGMAEAGFTAVIEESEGRRSYWALKHGDEKPDFHHPACFAARLGAPV